ncbi:MAG: ATP synthase F1 subunit delta [Roseburia sp.]|uniref:ATP synthase F1 subunit delta n=1 Tax=Roseburia sp. 831b TaxID=1261635 RepID=UPI0009517B3E|nr:ATP synthase F1 subunit delta [Roseburia sp. 831b]MCI5917878.1 ATP synthase F1 subunit delta [Roseburia sp.]MDD6215909.1 ATP synthase F1 subunit delta [Roseburia sp.]MDY5883842.1 ATP synthase F1 subunit delta [Roseburia sp.]WVK72569.1 ATP synthase F1 subunit delta [Roseburia sp. 831b]
MAKLVSKTYGDALFEVALEEDKLDQFLEEVKAVKAAIDENQDLFKLMSHPKVVKEEKIKVVEDIFSGKVSRELVGLIRMIVDKGHFEQIDSVFTYFIDEVKEYRNIGTAYVTSALELTDAQKSAIEKRLLETTKYVTFEMHYNVDAAIIGGLVIRIGDRVVDSSVRTKLADLTRELSKIQLKAGECAP